MPAPLVAPYDEVLGRSRRAVELGFDGLWFADETPMAYPGAIAMDAWLLMAALARDLPGPTLGSLVTAAVYRHPLLNAVNVSTLDHISGGRAILGMGAGGVPADLDGLGAGGTPGRELVERLDEQLDSIDRLLRGETVTRETGFHPMRDAWVERPLQSPRPPILVAAQGPRAIRVAARRADIWNTLGGQPIEGEALPLDEAIAETRRQIEQLEAACLEIGRSPASNRRSVVTFRAGVYASIDAFDEWVGRMLEIGIPELMIIHPGDDREAEAILERFATDSLPRLRGTEPGSG
ncbi:MAG TPA: LLM class flavin-dependent oxidoreductase, partial [Candidatus Deferrimicrobiaceae bacterium]|nr:LLM class flavin-dependent oxidoreductase [Candidatus Deferrimicrobiaceae bacterium]